jgi:carboxymethylenebutenolidase
MTPDQRREAILLYDRFTHEGMDRRAFMQRMTVMTGSAAAAAALVASIGASPAAAAITNPADPRLITGRGPVGEPSGLKGYVAAPKNGDKLGAVMVIHENRGLNAHIEDVARRIALEGFFVIAPDMLSLAGGTPPDEDQARDMIGKLDLSAAIASALVLGREMKKKDHVNGKLGIVGFCWGGAFVNRYAVAAGGNLDAGVAYYGPAPDPAEADKVKAPLLLHYAGLDKRVAQTGEPWVAALKKAGKPVTEYIYSGVDHAFNNDTSAERYNKAAADLAWSRTIAFFKKHLG